MTRPRIRLNTLAHLVRTCLLLAATLAPFSAARARPTMAAGGEAVLTAGELQVELDAARDGVRLVHVRGDGVELLNPAAVSEVFSLRIQVPGQAMDRQICASSGWGRVEVRDDGREARIVLSRPEAAGLPAGLTATVTLSGSGDGVDWGLEISGLGEASLMEVRFPSLNVTVAPAGHFLLPHYSGKLIPDPVGGGLDSQLLYPRGWSASMQFQACYDQDRGLYFGVHDPWASLKTMVAKSEEGGIRVETVLPAPDRTLPGNDFQLPGTFRLELFHGDWYDASQIYRSWVFSQAQYRPVDDPQRRERQQALGRVGLWIYYYSSPEDSADKQLAYLRGCAEYFSDFPLGIHWYRWGFHEFDDDYPRFFPELPWISRVVRALQDSGDVVCMPYINGRLYDTDLPDYPSNGLPYATKNRDGKVYTQHFNGNEFAVMCPTQPPWQDIMVDAVDQLSGRIGAAGVYVDQVCASTPKPCMDPHHGHPLGGGHWWRDGYRDMFRRMHQTAPPGTFLTVEGGTDYLADQVDGFLVQGWTTDHLVPAFPAVYAGSVQLFGVATGTSHYHDQQFYCKTCQAFVFGIQPGRASSYVVYDPHAEDRARPFLRRLGRMRYRLRRFLAFGRMLRPLRLNGEIPRLTTTWKDYGTPVQVTTPAIQHSVWKSQDGREVALVFANASMDRELECTVDVDAGAYGLNGEVQMYRVTEEDATPPRPVSSSFTCTVDLSPLAVEAYVLGARPATAVTSSAARPDTVCRVYPNPARDTLTVQVSEADTAAVYDVAGAAVRRLVLEPGANRVDVSQWPTGMYMLRMRCGRIKITVIH